MRLSALVFIAMLATASAALARETDEIIVTASRYVDRFESNALPAVTLSRRADFVVLDVAIESDSRDGDQRRAELQQTLSDLERRARNGGPVSVGLVREGPDGDAGETRVSAFTMESALETLRNGGRPDTSRVQIVLRTAVGPGDDLASCIKRLQAFLTSTPKPGRITATPGRPNLSLVNPAQYRPAVVAAIIAEGRKALTQAGPGHALKIEGLEARIAWRAAGDLDLILFVPHRLQIAPAGN